MKIILSSVAAAFAFALIVSPASAASVRASAPSHVVLAQAQQPKAPAAAKKAATPAKPATARKAQTAKPATPAKKATPKSTG